MNPTENFFHNNLCHICKKPDTKLKRCSSCKTLAYCSKEHQIQDWKNHSKLCKIITECEKSLEYNIKNFSDLRKYKINRSVLWQMHMKRELEPFESQMWMFPRYCAICYSRNNLETCSNCLSVFYCSEIHKNQQFESHNVVCSSFKLCTSIESYLFHKNSCGFYLLEDEGINVKEIGNEIVVLPATLDMFAKISLDIKEYKAENVNLETIFIYDIIIASCGTILYALEKSKHVNNRKFLKNSLTIHFVGADKYELSINWPFIVEIFFHWIVNLTEVNIVLIGPEIPENINKNIEIINPCSTCKTNKVVSTIKTVKNVYHNYAVEEEKPDLIVLLNSGLHEFQGSPQDTWKNSMQSLTMYNNTPILLTAYTEDEIDSNVKRLLEEENVEVVLEPQKNLFRNLRPFVDWDEVDKVFYINGYISVLQTK